MPEYRSLSRPLRIETAGRQFFGNDAESRVNDLWAAARAGNPALFDGPVLSVIDIAGDRLRVGEVGYRHVMAARMDSDLARVIRLRSLAVSGVLRCRDGVVLGQRAGSVTEDRGLWELVPSGGAATTDLIRQLLEELTEEVGLEPGQVTVGTATGLVLDRSVIDVIFPIVTDLSAEAVATAHAERSSGEYGQLMVTAAPRLFIAGRADVSATSRTILENQTV